MVNTKFVFIQTRFVQAAANDLIYDLTMATLQQAPQQVLSSRTSRVQVAAVRTRVSCVRGRQSLRVLAASATAVVTTTGKASLQGTSRKQNEDRLVIEVVGVL